MKRSIVKIIFIFASLICFVSAVKAETEDQKAFVIAKQNACLGCHAVDRKIVGPSFQSVAQKYKNDQSAAAFLKKKIVSGGSGSWGIVPMPANAKLNDADLSLLVNWVLRGAPN